jgi:hypothetical protein
MKKLVSTQNTPQEARMYPMLEEELQRQAAIDRQRAAADARRARYGTMRRADALVAAAGQDVVIRTADAGDVLALINLSDLDSQPLPSGKVLVAEIDGEIRAALSVESGRLVADPFVSTINLRALLRLRADQLQSTTRRRGGLLGRLALRPHTAA